MSLAILSSYAMSGIQATPVQVEVHVGAGLPAFNIVGLPGAGVRESRERVRSAIISSGFDFPAGRITANLAPADLPKDSGRFDLAIALGVLLASGQLPDSAINLQQVKNLVLVGELSLTGSLLANNAALVIALSAIKENPNAILVMAAKSAQIAALVPGLRVLKANSLKDLILHVSNQQELPPAQPLAIDIQNTEKTPCMSDVRGQLMAREALELAAAGGHNLLMCGPPGVGKSMLAHRLIGLLPELTHTEMLESAAVHSLVASLKLLPKLPPFRAPHHGASMPAMVGGGLHPRPGEISLAHNGILFLDELPEFERHSLEALREPIETGHITVSRSSGSCKFPANFQLIAAMNPCPCGSYKSNGENCQCSPERVRRYKDRISGPLLDRIDIYINLDVEKSWAELKRGEPSSVIKKRVLVARARQLQRQGCLNSKLSSAQLELYARLGTTEQELLNQYVQKWGLSARATQRFIRLTRTVADLAASNDINTLHLDFALQFRISNFYC